MRIYYGDGNDNFNTYFTVNPSPVPVPGDDYRAIDLNGDGKDDFIFEKTTAGTSGFYYMLNNGTSLDAPVLIQSQAWNANTGFSGKSRRNALQENDNEISGDDYNGDGVNDIFIHDPGGNWSIKSFINSSGQKTSTLNTLGSGTNSNLANEVLSADFNGDGESEIWCLTSSNLYIYCFTGTSLTSTYSFAVSMKTNMFNLGDFNGDGKIDLFIYGSWKASPGVELDLNLWQIQLSTGTAFELHEIVQKKANLKNNYVRLGDFNANGATDIMVTSKDQSWTGTKYYISSNNGTDFYVHSIEEVALFQNYYLADYNGDGQTDFVCTDSQPSPWWNGYTISKPNANTSFLMEKVGNGLGNVTKLTYTKLSQATSSVYQRGTGAVYPVKDYQGQLSVVSSVLYDNGKGSYNTINYYYEGIKIHLQGKGFLGFVKTRASDLTSQIDNETISSYNTTYFYPQLTRTFTKMSNTTDTIQTVKYIWNHIVLDASRKRIFPFVQSSTQLNKLTGQSITTTFQYTDGYGNPNTVVKSYSGGPTVTTTNIYENIVSPKWLLGRPTSTTVQYVGNGNTITRSGSRVFNSNSNNLATETWYAGTNNQIVNTYLYTPNGSLKYKTSTANSVSRTTRYSYQSDSTRLSMIIEPYFLNFIAYGYDTYGRISTTRNYNDIIETSIYDDFGRPLQSSTNTGMGSTMAYRWEDPSAEPKNLRFSIIKSGVDGSTNKNWYDKLGRECAQGLIGLDGTWIYINKKYNFKGQIDSISEPQYSNGTAFWNRFFYDNYGRKTRLNRPSGRNSTWNYINNSVIDTTAGKSSTKTFSSDGTIASVTDNGGTINYSYYPDGKVKIINAPGSITTSMQYDIAGNQTQLIDPSGGTITNTYDGFGQITNQQNGSGQTTQFTYFSDGRFNQKIQSTEGTTTYNYDLYMQLSSVISPGNIKQRFVYDTLGRVTGLIDSIPGTSKFVTSYTYDTKGRLSKITHPSGIVETKNYNAYGYLSSIAAGGATRWTTTAMNTRQQITGGTYGSNLNTTLDYDDYGYLKKISTGTIQDYSYNFDPVNGNLTSRQNNKYSNLKEDFTYDNLNRLDIVSMGGTTTLDMAYDSNKGGIISKTDVGTMLYGTPGKPYAVSTINPATSLTPPNAQTITNTSFGMVSTISEDNYKDTIMYNSNNERVKMVVYQGSNNITTRWYSKNDFMQESLSGTIKTYTYIGGNAYSAPCLAVRQGTTKIRYYYLLRDHLGSITHIIDTTNNKLFEYSYDVWGRKRNPSTWVNYPAGADTSFTRRGFTSHEQLPWFNLINMNGRVYDPLIGQFISPDIYCQNPFFTQNYNRYIYCLNNPLRYADPSGFVKQKLQSYQIKPEYFEEFLEAYVQSQGNLSYALNRAPHISETVSYDTDTREMEFSIVSSGRDETTRGFSGGYYSPGDVYYTSQKQTVRLSPLQSNTIFVNNRPGNQSGTDADSWGSALDYSTVGKNIPLIGGRSTYAGGNNPLTNDKDYTYQYTPTMLTDYPAIGHDRRYDNLKTQGFKGLYSDTRAIGADWRFVGEELGIAASPDIDPITRINATLLGIGLGLMATPKTLYQFTQPGGLGIINTIMWYNISNVGVTNMPSSNP